MRTEPLPIQQRVDVFVFDLTVRTEPLPTQRTVDVFVSDLTVRTEHLPKSQRVDVFVFYLIVESDLPTPQTVNIFRLLSHCRDRVTAKTADS